MIATNRSLSALAALLVACGGGDTQETPDATPIDFDRRALLAHIGEDVVLATYTEFRGDTEELAAAIATYCDALGTAGEAEALAAAQAAWATAMATWQRADQWQFGPAGDSGGALRDLIYSWPVTSPCAVDQDVMLVHTDPTAYDITTRLTNRRGLDALEYALHAPTLDSVCPPQAVPAGWAELPEADQRAARCAFAELAAADLATQATALEQAWSPSGGDYLGAFVGAADPNESLQALFGALFYLDKQVKDAKLAEPAGLATNSCGTTGEPCPAELESQWAHVSRDNLIANLAGFAAVWRGVGGPAFDHFLRAAADDATADAFASDLDAAETAVEAIPASMDHDAMLDAHAAVKRVTDRLKGDVPGHLGLQIPDEAGGDTD